MQYQEPLPFSVSDWHPAPAAERGAIFTRPEVVAFILDLAGYTADRPLAQLRLLEPAIGHGDFLLPAIDRLITAWRADPALGGDVAALEPAIRGVELHEESFRTARQAVIALLVRREIARPDAERLADTWLTHGDFLLTNLGTTFHVVVGNPPYVRQELIPAALMALYRARFRTIYDRADLYIPFIEQSLLLLEPDGHLAFICADRWMKNRYGGPLRQLIAERFFLKTYVDMVDTPAFQSEVIAYPAITVIAHARGTTTRIARRPQIDAAALRALAAALTAATPPSTDQVRCLDGVAAGAEPWILESDDQLALVRRLEAQFPTIEEVGCTVGIGVATGADKAFIGPFDALDVEDDRKLPLVTTRDIVSGTVAWRGLGVINPFDDAGGLVPLDRYPRLRRYLEERRAVIASRHIAMRAPASWYRTIDRITPALAQRPKLLIPDIKGEAHIVFEPGALYPHHNLYYLISDTWDLRALQTILRSGIARLFVSVYSTRMRGGYMRFQAQYLRRIRVPPWDAIPNDLRRSLIDAAASDDPSAGNRAVARLYQLSAEEQDALGVIGDEPTHDA
ncbi:N-6 DNA methylase [Chloroflexia bacterium SDU3-3]|nr:N-6 DNA methylase [Chloroflexia bacterium SDU3-3]